MYVYFFVLKQVCVFKICMLFAQLTRKPGHLFIIISGIYIALTIYAALHILHILYIHFSPYPQAAYNLRSLTYIHTSNFL